MVRPRLPDDSGGWGREAEREREKPILAQATTPARNQFPGLQMHHMLARLRVDGRGRPQSLLGSRRVGAAEEVRGELQFPLHPSKSAAQVAQTNKDERARARTHLLSLL